MPVSATETFCLPPARARTETVITPPSGVNFTAFEIRLSNTCFHAAVVGVDLGHFRRIEHEG